MALVFHLGTPTLESHGQQWILRAELSQSVSSSSDERTPVADFGFRVEGVSQPASGPAAFYPLALLAAMHAGVPLVVHGALPGEWQRASRKFQEIISTWMPSLHVVDVSADWKAIPARISESGIGVIFSADLDSFHTLRHVPATHLVYIESTASVISSAQGSDMCTDGLGISIRAAAAQLDLPVIKISPEISFVRGASMIPGNFLAPALAAASRVLADNLSQVAWGSPRGWLAPPCGGDHFALFECFDAPDLRMRVCGRNASYLAKWRAVTAMPVARECLRVCPDASVARPHCGRCPSCLKARLAMHVLAVDPAWPGLPRIVEADLAACIATDKAFCRQAFDVLRQQDPNGEFTSAMEASLRLADLDEWADRLAELGHEAIESDVWRKLSRRLLPHVLVTAAAKDPNWLRTLARLPGFNSLENNG